MIPSLIFTAVASREQLKSHDFPRADEVTLTNMDKFDKGQTTTQTMCKYLGNVLIIIMH